MKVTVYVRRRPEIADPQGTAVSRALADLGYGQAKVRINKEIVLEMPDASRYEVEAKVTEMCEVLLANPVMDDFEIRIDG
jgi:phosphoribosylformylglycinamidine synthase PurS subunit